MSLIIYIFVLYSDLFNNVYCCPIFRSLIQFLVDKYINSGHKCPLLGCPLCRHFANVCTKHLNVQNPILKVERNFFKIIIYFMSRFKSKVYDLLMLTSCKYFIDLVQNKVEYELETIVATPKGNKLFCFLINIVLIKICF
jgi:hypothetical protein